MATLWYKLEYVFDETAPADSSVYIHLRDNPPIYQSHIDKEDYDVLPTELKHDFLTGLFVISGVVELSTKAYRVWLMKSPVFTWPEVIDPVIDGIRRWYNYDDIKMLPGSAFHDGTGTTLNSPNNRRKV